MGIKSTQHRKPPSCPFWIPLRQCHSVLLMSATILPTEERPRCMSYRRQSAPVRHKPPRSPPGPVNRKPGIAARPASAPPPILNCPSPQTQAARRGARCTITLSGWRSPVSRICQQLVAANPAENIRKQPVPDEVYIFTRIVNIYIFRQVQVANWLCGCPVYSVSPVMFRWYPQQSRATRLCILCGPRPGSCRQADCLA